MTLTVRSLGPYEILGPLGAGGMGEVYRARDTRLQREVAVKVLRGFSGGSSDAIERFHREARAVAALSHPNILAIHDVGEENGVIYAVMELLEGETLRERVTASAIPARKAVEYALQIARGLAAAHDRGIVHRDLKPENVFLTKNGLVKILDFGLATLSGAPGSADVSRSPTVGTQPGVVARHSRVHVPRAGPRQTRRPPERPVLARRRSSTRCSRAGGPSAATARPRP